MTDTSSYTLDSPPSRVVDCVGGFMQFMRFRYNLTNQTVFYYVEYEPIGYPEMWSFWIVPGTMNCDDF